MVVLRVGIMKRLFSHDRMLHDRALRKKADECTQSGSLIHF